MFYWKAQPGVIDVIDDGLTGYLFETGEVDSLVRAIECVIALDYEQMTKMGLAGRLKVEKEFNREIVIQKYMIEVENA